MKFIIIYILAFCSLSIADANYPSESHSLDDLTLEKIKYELIPPGNLDRVTGERYRYSEKWLLNIVARYFPTYSSYGVCKSRYFYFRGLESEFNNNLRKAGESKTESTLVWIPENKKCENKKSNNAVNVFVPVVEHDLYFILINKKTILDKALDILDSRSKYLLGSDYILSSLNLELNRNNGEYVYVAMFGEFPKNTLGISFTIVKGKFIFGKHSSITQY